MKLQRDIDRLGSWARKWGMRFQPVKCNMMQLTRKRIKKIHASYTLEGTNLENVRSHEHIHMWLVMSIFNTWVANDSCEASHFREFIWTYIWYKGGNPSNLKKKYHLKLELFMSICRDFHILMWLSPVLVHTSCGLLLSGYSMSIYYVACFYVAHKSFPIEKCHVFIAF